MPDIETADTLPPAMPEPLIVNALELDPARSASSTPGEITIDHAAHMGAGWFELRAGASVYVARIDAPSVQRLSAAGFLSAADVEAIARAAADAPE